MGDANTVLTEAHARHMLRRTLMGASRKTLESYWSPGMTRGDLADVVIGERPRRFRPVSRDRERAHAKWIRWMTKGKAPFQSKLVLFFHDHFATSIAKVEDLRLMGDQIKLLYTHALGNFRDLVKDINRNPAMMEFLDTVRNYSDIPNENYSRELKELFTLGVVDLAGQPNYVQQDVQQIARAFTGWGIRKRRAEFRDFDHDYEADFPERGPKVIFQSTGGFGGGGVSFAAAGEGEVEIDTVTDILFQHRDSEGEVTVARRLAFRLLEYFAYAAPSKALVDQVVSESGFDAHFDLPPLYRAILTNDAFYETAASPPYGAGTKKSVKWPAEFVVGTCRLLKMKLKGPYQYPFGGSFQDVYTQMVNMGQALLEPPSVFGWDWEEGWISTAALLARYNFARDVAAARYGGLRFRPEDFVDFSLTDPDAILDDVLDALDIAHQVSATDRAALIDYLTDSGANPTLDLQDEFVANTKLRGCFSLAMQSPAFMVY